jgi:hypothetical protein
VSSVPKVKIEVVAPDDQAEDFVESIRAGARTGDIGDGKIFTLVDRPYELAKPTLLLFELMYLPTFGCSLCTILFPQTEKIIDYLLYLIICQVGVRHSFWVVHAPVRCCQKPLQRLSSDVLSPSD